MKKKLIICTAIAAVFSFGCLAFTACNVKNDGDEHFHTPDNVWHTNEIYHWHECTAGDGAKTDIVAHEYTDEQDTTCNVCGYERTITPPTHIHTPESDWSSDANTHWHNCVAGDGARFDEAVHEYTDEQDATCNTCGYERTITPPEHTHTADDVWHTDETNHWHLCTAGDGEQMDKAVHVYDDDQDATCNVCGFERTVTPPSSDNVAVTGVSLNKESLTLYAIPGGLVSVGLKATVMPENATNKAVTWASDNTAVATVDQNGVVWGGSTTGTANITVTTEDGNFTATCVVTIADHTHTAATEWQNDETNHWHQCTADDGEQMDKAAHEYDNEQDATCNVCGYVREVTPPEHTHTADTVWHTDETNHWHECTAGDGEQMDKAAHEYDDEYDATCDVCGYEREVVTITITISGENTVAAGSTLALTATVLPSSITDPVTWAIISGGEYATIDESTGVLTANAAGSVAVTATVKGVTSTPFGVTINEAVSGDLILTYSYSGNECAAFEWSESTPANSSVKYKLSTDTSYTTLDSQLIRSAATSGYARADIVGLKGGASYDFVITASSGKTATVTKSVTAYDRSGYAHFNYTSGVGAYNDDGTPKANAQIIYVSEATKNTVTAKLGSKTYTGIVSILGGLSSSDNPVIIRVLGTIGAATWNKIDYNADKKYNGSNLMPAEVVVGINGKQLPTNSNTYQADLISGGYNTLNTSVWSELEGLDSRAKYSGGEYDTIWNNCPIKGASNVTLEGIGEDARLFQWGLTWQYCNSIEVRNLTFEDYTEDACSFEGSVASTTIDGFNSQRIWLHHNTFEEGINYWDLTAEQDKHEGDGATDFKQLSYLTTSYNVHHNNHKTGLVGGSDSTKTACVTFHHNYYNNNSSRLPLGRQANMHMYNNYYYKSTGTNMSIRAGAYAFIENCYFENCTTPIEIKTGDSKTGAVKLYNNVFSGKNYSSNSYIYEVTDRTKVVANDNIYNQKFDTDSSVFYYDATNKVTDVSVMYTAEETKINVPLLAGVQKRNGTTAIDPEGGNQGGSSGGESGSGSESGGETVSSTSITADNCGVSAGSAFTSATNDVFTLENTSSSTYTVTALLAAGGGTSATANDNSGLTFSNAFLPSSASGVSMTVTAKKAVNLTVYYTTSDSKFNTQSQSKSGYLQWTINGGSKQSDSNTANKDGRTAYAVNVELSAGDVLVLTSSGNRLVIFGLVGQ